MSSGAVSVSLLLSTHITDWTDWLTAWHVVVVGSVLIFVTKKSNCVELANNLRLNDFNGTLLVAVYSGDVTQLVWACASCSTLNYVVV